MPSTSTSTSPSTATVVANLQTTMKVITDLSGQNSLDTLQASWNYLQVYATWCLRLPNTQSLLNTTLGITDPGRYSFYPAMLTAYQSVSNSGSYFLNTIFLNIIGLGNDLNSFATTAGNNDGTDGIFSTVKQQLATITPATTPADAQSIIQNNVLPLLAALQQRAVTNATNAASVITQLSTYKSDLETAQSQLTAVDTAVNSDAATSQATINTLGGGPSVSGSLANLEALKKSEQSEYQHDVTIATTSLTYAWVCIGPIPVGLITAASVAGVYGAKATAMLKAVDETENQIATAQSELATAISTHTVQSTAKSGLDSALTYTDQAVTQTTTLQNSWNSVSSNITDIQNELNNTTFGAGSTKQGQSKIVIDFWLDQATTHWNNIIPLVTVLMEHPYITVLPGNTTASDLLK